MLEIQGLSLSIEGRLLLSHFHASLRPSDFIVLSGASGVGKSSLLSLLHAGSSDRVKKNAQSSLLSQNMPLTDRFSALENVLLGELDGTLPWWKTLWQFPKQSQTRAEKLLNDLGLESHHDALTASLSGGEKARVATARALLKPKRLVFADEPTAALDATNARLALETLKKEICDQGGAVLCVLHSPELAQGLATTWWTWNPLTQKIQVDGEDRQ